MKMQNFKKQKGNAVIGILFVLVVLSFITLAYYKHLQWQKLQESAQTTGHQISMVVDALEKRLSFDENFSTGNYGLKDLINKSCGGKADDDYLPCCFTLQNYVNDGTINIIVTTSKDNEQIRLATLSTSTIGIPQSNNRKIITPTAYLAGEVLAAAQATKAFAGNQYLSASVSYDLDIKKSIVEANIVANQNNSNIFLRVDGSNKMQNALQFNKELNADHRMVKYISSLTNDSDLTIDAPKVLLGNQSGIKGNSNVVVNDLTIHSMGDKPLTSLLNSMPVGGVIAYAGFPAPDGYLECNGASFSSSTYPKLYQAVGGTKIPDLRGQFVRGWDHGAGVDTGRVLGVAQGDAIQNIKGTFGNYSTTGQTASGVFSVVRVGSNSYARGHSLASVRATFDASKVARTANENRPKNIALMYIIKHD